MTNILRRNNSDESANESVILIYKQLKNKLYELMYDKCMCVEIHKNMFNTLSTSNDYTIFIDKISNIEYKNLYNYLLSIIINISNKIADYTSIQLT